MFHVIICLLCALRNADRSLFGTCCGFPWPSPPGHLPRVTHVPSHACPQAPVDWEPCAPGGEKTVRNPRSPPLRWFVVVSKHSP